MMSAYAEMWLDTAREAASSQSPSMIQYRRQQIDAELACEELSQEEHDKIASVLDDALCPHCG